MDRIKQRESEALGVYHLYWDSYTKGNLEAFSATLDDAFQMIGTSESEVCHNKEEGIEFYKAQLSEVVGKAEMRNRQINAVPVGDMILVNELCDIYVLAGADWNFYSKIRISTFLRETSDGWKVVQQHGSLPDMRVQEGETLAIEKISRENLELRDAVKRHTADLENKNRELEIEAALERVRAAAMAMHQSDELPDMLSVLFDQFDILGINPSFTHLTLFDEISETFSFRMSGRAGHRVLVEQIHDINRLEAWKIAFEHWKNGDPNTISCIDYPPEVLPMMFDIIGPILSAMPEESRVRIEDFPNGLYTVQGHCKFGYLGFHHNRSATEEEKNIVVRFAGEFGRVYQRFLDLKKAEAQAREAQIENALEKVRSRTMAMQHSEELAETSIEMFSQMQALGMRPWACGFNIFEKDEKAVTQWMSAGDGSLSTPFTTPLTEDPFFIRIYEARQRREELFVMESGGHELEETYKYMFGLPAAKKALGDIMAMGFEMPKFQISHCAFFSQGYLMFITYEPYPEAHDIFRRFAKVYEQTYTRFLDLQKAETQTKEAQIEAALERVRSSSLAMHQTSELGDVVKILFEQFFGLGLDFYQVWINIFKLDEGISNCWFSPVEGVFDEPYTAVIPLNPFEDSSIKSWRAGEEFSYLSWQGRKEVDQIATELSKITGHPSFKQIQQKKKMDRMEILDCNHKYGVLAMAKNEDFTEEDHKILKRFTKAFEQAFTRFLDLQKAEEQAREAEIQLALERVRARTMAMHHSDELGEVAILLYKEFNSLNIADFFNCGFIIINETEGIQNGWMTQPEGSFIEEMNLPYPGDELIQRRAKAWKEKISVHHDSIGGENFKIHKKYVSERSKSASQVNTVMPFMPDPCHFYCGNFEQGYLHIVTKEELREEDVEILSRFTKVFEQTYTRFLDLQKAEKQAKEAQIETALEKVRSRTMAMQKSEELLDLVKKIYSEIEPFGVSTTGITIALFREEENAIENWYADNLHSDLLQSYKVVGQKNKVFKQIWEDWKNKNPQRKVYLEGPDKRGYDNYILTETDYRQLPEELKEEIHSHKTVCFTFTYFKYGYFESVDLTIPAEENAKILLRFAKVFEQTYTRFLDLQKAEAQARESEIELALERVRAKTMAMQKSDELSDVAALLFKQIKILGAELWTISIAFCKEDELIVEKWGGSPITDQIFAPNFIPYNADHGEQSMYDTWKNKVELYSYVQEGKVLKDIYDHLMTIPSFKANFQKVIDAGRPLPVWQKNHVVSFKYGYLLVITEEEFKEEYVFTRFAKVFEQTYTRFLDLQKVEAQAIEATKQASLDRVRGEIASMRSAKDLEIITPLIWNELTTLGIPFIRCGVFIIHEEDEQVEVYLSKPDGTSLAVMHLPFNSSDLAIQTVSAWQQKSVYTQHWSREEFLDWGRSMIEQGQVPDLKSYQGAEEAPESLHLHFIPFNQGMLYVGSTDPLKDEEISLSESLAKAFSIAYARYEDFVKLEKAKAGIEDALTELKATQSQLVQQEKLASLGQLTAGIAHEIKNPLNFVNNFSEVSLELVEEAREEVRRETEDRRPGSEKAQLRQGFDEQAKVKSEKSPFDLPSEASAKGGGSAEAIAEVGDVTISANDETTSLILEILDDIEANLRKIHEHGSRADGIVQSMLMHSRGGDGKMEPTPLNPIIKEYVNLAFHGMRASKEPINVDIDLQLDENVGEVPLVAEDFSRVILNLCNNAFDAMRDKLTGDGGPGTGYVPKLTVQTHQGEKTITIGIEDNGPGIPEEIKDKILQPFFTTKKGTQGTGLGLSITNDIIKAHGGELMINTSPSGTTFTILLKE
jgi:signal transduction histidine kinase